MRLFANTLLLITDIGLIFCLTITEMKSRCRHCAAILGIEQKQKGLSIAAKPFYKLVEAAGLEPASRKPTSSALHV
jgi:hypothetical protein